MQLPPIAATTIGSFPGPVGSRRTSAAGRFSGWKAPRERKRRMTHHVEHPHSRTDRPRPAFGRRTATHRFYQSHSRRFDGIDLEHEAVKKIYRRREQPRPVPRIVGKIKRRAPAIVDDLRFAKAQTDKPIKMDVPGPMTVIDSTLDEFYKDEADDGDGRGGGAQRGAARLAGGRMRRAWRSTSPP